MLPNFRSRTHPIYGAISRRSYSNNEAAAPASALDSPVPRPRLIVVVEP